MPVLFPATITALLVSRTVIASFQHDVGVQVCPASVVCHSPPATVVPVALKVAQPSSLFLNQNSLNHTKPAPPPITGAVTAFQVTPPSVVRKILNSWFSQ